MAPALERRVGAISPPPLVTYYFPITLLQQPSRKHMRERGSLHIGATKRLSFLIHRDLLSRSAQPSRRGNKRERSTPCLMSSWWPSGWASFSWRWVTRMPANAASEENENAIRLRTRRPRRCRPTLLFVLRTAAA